MSNPRLKICLIADHLPNLDEGMNNIAFHLSNIFSSWHEVKHFSHDRISSKYFWKEVKDFDPDIVHYIPGPSIFSLMITKILKTYCGHPKTVVSAVHPVFYGLKGLRYGPYCAISSLLSHLIPFLKPDIVLVQSSKSESLFRRLGCLTEFVPSGVNTTKFSPATPDLKRRLRQKYGFDPNALVVIHVGPLSWGRNVRLMTKLHDSNTKVVLVGSTKNRTPGVCQHLRESGCLVWHEYLENIEEFYQLADCYVFPTTEDRSCIETPLSVLEAMSCNLPVISTKFGALPRLFEEGHGFFFAETEADFIRYLQKVRDGGDTKTREMVLRYSWENVAQQIERVYARVYASLLDDSQII
jgi:glycosyltransferase involved in cell wall biosynthesis